MFIVARRCNWVKIIFIMVLPMFFVGCQMLSSNSSTGSGGSVALSSSKLNFGTVTVGSSKNLQDSITNTTAGSVTISSVSGANAGFQVTGVSFPLVVAAGQSASFTVKFTPSASGAAAANLTLASDALSSPLAVSLSGTGVTAGSLSANPASLAFGSVQVGSHATLSETIKNTGGSTINISSAAMSDGTFSLSGMTLPTTLTPSESLTFNVAFTPSVAASKSGNLTLTSDAANSSLVISLSGTGTAAGQLAVSPATLNFGSVAVGASSSLPSTISATGASVTVSSIHPSNGEFTISGISLPATIAAGQNASFTVTFKPQATGAASGTIGFSSSASNSVSQSLAGNGTSPPQHSVSLSWAASSSQGITGYNVYRGAVSGGPYSMVNPSLDASTSYTDSQVTAGQTYYYVVTAVDSSGQESGYSNQVQAVIPSP